MVSRSRSPARTPRTTTSASSRSTTSRRASCDSACPRHARAGARLRRARGRHAAFAARDRLDHRRARPDRSRRPRLFRSLRLRREHAHGHGARSRDRLRPVRRLALPRGACPRPGEARRDRRRRRHRESRGALQRHRLHPGHDRHAARREHDHAQPRDRGHPRRLRLDRRRADAHAGRAEPARRPRQPAARARARAPDRQRGGEPLLDRGRDACHPSPGSQSRRGRCAAPRRSPRLCSG